MPPEQWHADLPAVGMAGQRQCDPLRNFRKDVRLMGKEQDGIVGFELPQCSRQIVDPAEATRTNR